jgi:hypothetical protein
MNCGVDCSGGLQPWITRLLYPSFVWFRGLLDATTDTYITSFRLHHNRRVLFIRSIDCDFCCLKLWTNAPAATKHLHGPYMCEFWSSAGAALLEWLALNFVSSVGSSRRTWWRAHKMERGSIFYNQDDIRLFLHAKVKMVHTLQEGHLATTPTWTRYEIILGAMAQMSWFSKLYFFVQAIVIMNMRIKCISCYTNQVQLFFTLNFSPVFRYIYLGEMRIWEP